MPITGTCEQCGQAIETFPSRLKARNFCSRDCANDWQRAHGKRVNKPCEWCQAPMIVKSCIAHRYRFCSDTCRLAYVDEETPKRFWALVDESAHPKGCWIYTGRVNVQRGGYGTFDDHRVTKRAHRYAWEITNGPIPDDLDVCHRCDNPPCVRPDHLFLGTRKENAEDCVEKGRSNHGERHGLSKLTDTQTAELRAKYKAGGVSQLALAREYSVSPMLVSLIVRDKIRRKH